MYHLCYFLLEHVTLCEFGWVHYRLNERKNESTTQDIYEYKSKQKTRTIYAGASSLNVLENEEWKERCKNLLQTFFSEDARFSRIITFPDTKISVRGKPWEGIINTLKYWCENSSRGICYWLHH